MEQVSISRGALRALVAALVVSLLALAFMLGRESRGNDRAAADAATTKASSSASEGSPRGPDVARATANPAETKPLAITQAAPASQAEEKTLPLPTPPAERRATARPEVPPSAGADGVQTSLRRPSGPPSENERSPAVHTSVRATDDGAADAPRSSGHGGGASPDPALRAQVQAYFHQVDDVAPGSLGGDPTALANEMLQGAVNGDTHQLDAMIRNAETAERKMRGLHPPAPCAQFHTRAMALTAESTRTLRALKQGISSGDMSGLTAMSARAGQMQSDAEALQRDEETLKRRYLR